MNKKWIIFAVFFSSSCLITNNLYSKKWSILICTLEERRASFERLYETLTKQIDLCGLENEIEILSCLDNREASVGHKRNFLLQASQGEYINFIDDDDDVHDNYIKMIYEKLKNNPDCVSLKGVMTVDGKNPRLFIHSIKYRHYFQKKNVYYRPPNHLNPIKRSIAIQFPFPDKYFGEDTDWAMAIARSGLIKTEEKINVTYYFYKYQSKAY